MFTAAMRLRQLATTQSIMFLAPPEVHQSILDVRQKENGDRLDSYDVICWLLEQTCSGIEQLQPLQYSQGVDFCRRTQALRSNPDFVKDEIQRNEVLGALREKEHQTLKQLYNPKGSTKSIKGLPNFDGELSGYMKDLKHRRKNFQDTGSAVHASALQEVQQEREVAFEVEAVREIQKPNHIPPLTFPGLHQDIESFVKTGLLAHMSPAYENAIGALRRTPLGQKYGIKPQAGPRLLLSREFMRTVRAQRVASEKDYIVSIALPVVSNQGRLT